MWLWLLSCKSTASASHRLWVLILLRAWFLFLVSVPVVLQLHLINDRIYFTATVGHIRIKRFSTESTRQNKINTLNMDWRPRQSQMTIFPSRSMEWTKMKPVSLSSTPIWRLLFKPVIKERGGRCFATLLWILLSHNSFFFSLNVVDMFYRNCGTELWTDAKFFER